MLEIINQRNMKFLFDVASKPRNVSELAKRAGMTYSNTSILISRLARENVAIKTTTEGSRGREIIITLTDYGKEQVRLLKQIKRNYKENKTRITEKGGKNAE